MGRSKHAGNYFKLSLQENTIEYRNYFFRLLSLAVTMIGYEGMPKSVDKRFLELTLSDKGKALFFKDEIMGVVCMTFNAGGEFDIYRNPYYREAWAINGYTNTLNPSNSVIAWNNFMREPDLCYISSYAAKLGLLDRIIMINCNAQKTPILLRALENQRLSILNLYKEYDGGAPVIFGDKNLDLDSLKAIQTLAPFTADKIYELKVNYWNEALTYLGIPNISVQKKERLIADEVGRTMGGVIASRYSKLESRKEACEGINDMFGLNVKPYVREFTEQELRLDPEDLSYAKEGEGDGEVYD